MLLWLVDDVLEVDPAVAAGLPVMVVVDVDEVDEVDDPSS
jgi:hypothetical protein